MSTAVSSLAPPPLVRSLSDSGSDRVRGAHMKAWRGYPLTRSAQAIDFIKQVAEVEELKRKVYLAQRATIRSFTVITTEQSSSARDSMPGWERECAKAKALRREIRELKNDPEFIEACNSSIRQAVSKKLWQSNYSNANTRLCKYFPKCQQMETCGFAHTVRVWIPSALAINAQFKSGTCRRPRKCPYHRLQACDFIHPVDVRVVRNRDGSFQGLAFGPDRYRSKKREHKESKTA